MIKFICIQYLRAFLHVEVLEVPGGKGYERTQAVRKCRVTTTYEPIDWLWVHCMMPHRLEAAVLFLRPATQASNGSALQLMHSSINPQRATEFTAKPCEGWQQTSERQSLEMYRINVTVTGYSQTFFLSFWGLMIFDVPPQAVQWGSRFACKNHFRNAAAASAVAFCVQEWMLSWA